MKRFAVADFVTSQDVEIIHTNWLLDDTVCAWPPYKYSRLSKALLTGEQPAENWKTYEVVIRGYYNCYETALNNCLKTESTSDLEIVPSSNEKKTRKKRKRIILSDSEEEEEHCKSPYPQVVPNSSCLQEHMSENQSLLDIPANESTDSPLFLILPQSQSMFSNTPTSTCESPKSPLFPVSSQSQSVLTHAPANSSNSISLCTALPQASVQDEPTSVEKQMLIVMLDIQRMLKEHTVLINKLLNKNEESSESIEFLANLPLKSMKELEELENTLQNDEYFSKTVQFLGNRGGHDFKVATRCILQFLLVDEIASKFNWAGRGEKSEFRKLRLKNVVVYAVKDNMSTRDTPIKLIETVIKDWLKYAPMRVMYRKRKTVNLK